jgi:hypothetical protein
MFKIFFFLFQKFKNNKNKEILNSYKYFLFKAPNDRLT